MTRLAILADIHGNLPALEAIISDMQSFNVDHVVVAGDCINRGPFSVEVMERLFALNWTLMRGNHEFFLLDYGSSREPDDWKTFTTPRWMYTSFSPSLRNRIASLPDTLQLRFQNAPLVRVVHGIPGNPWKGIYPLMSDDEIADILRDTVEDTVIAAHTHLPMDRCVGRWHLINPGSVGVPVDGKHAARYVILDSHADGWEAEHRSVNFDLARLLAACDDPAYLESLGTDAYLFREEFKRARAIMFAYQRWHTENLGTASQTMATIDQFLQLDDEVMESYIVFAYRLENILPIRKGQ